MSFSLPANFIAELSKFLVESVNLPNTPENKKIEKSIPGLIKEFISGDAAPYMIKIARHSDALSSNSGKIVIVVPPNEKGPVFVGYNDTHFTDLKKCVKDAAVNRRRVTQKVHPTYGPGFTVSFSETGDDHFNTTEEFIDNLQHHGDLIQKNLEAVVVRVAPRPETAYTKFLKEAARKHPENDLTTNAKLWNDSEEKKAADAAKKSAAEAAEAAKKTAEAVPAVEPTLVIPDPDATLVIPEAPVVETKKRLLLKKKN